MSWYFDSHAHYDSRRFREDQQQVLAQMEPNHVRRIMNVGCDLASSYTSIALAEQYDFIYAAVGSHPDDAANVDEARVEEYRQLARHPRVRAIGEIGLDYYYEDVPRAKQQEAFRMQMALAQELSMPVIIHQRDAYEDALKIVDEFPAVRGVFHCFSGSLEYAKEVVKRGYYMGFTGVITFKNARKAVEVAQWAPLNRLLIETDCPYMAPEPFRGKRCDSTMLPRMAEKIAGLRGLSTEEIAKITRENAMELFGVDAP
ncbi:MAG: TatD family hydrolase [Oscillospiraceae bacterium]|nr:TatD family hydrolase [Oscillospiraceae bacterium]